MFYETWYKSVLLTRKIKIENITDEERVLRLQRLGSNCINLLAGPARCDLKNRDFSDCAIPYAYFYKRDLSGSKNWLVMVEDYIIFLRFFIQ